MQTINIITPTRHRPLGIELCERQIRRMDRDGLLVRWVICDGSDGAEDAAPRELEINLIKQVVAVPPRQSPARSLCANLLAGLAYVDPLGGMVAIIEDDDWYHPKYLRTVAANLQRFDAFGFVPSIYYNLPTRQYRNCNNHNHASLCCTAFKGEQAAKHMVEVAQKGYIDDRAFVDMNFWAKVRHGGLNFALKEQKLLATLGIKGLPGAPGIGMGHRPRGDAWVADEAGTFLRETVGEEYFEIYQGLSQ